jgi:hypothetical protein
MSSEVVVVALRSASVNRFRTCLTPVRLRSVSTSEAKRMVAAGVTPWSEAPAVTIRTFAGRCPSWHSHPQPALPFALVKVDLPRKMAGGGPPQYAAAPVVHWHAYPSERQTRRAFFQIRLLAAALGRVSNNADADHLLNRLRRWPHG